MSDNQMLVQSMESSWITVLLIGLVLYFTIPFILKSIKSTIKSIRQISLIKKEINDLKNSKFDEFAT